MEVAYFFTYLGNFLLSQEIFFSLQILCPRLSLDILDLHCLKSQKIKTAIQLKEGPWVSLKANRKLK